MHGILNKRSLNEYKITADFFKMLIRFDVTSERNILKEFTSSV